MANMIVERGRCVHAAVNHSVCESSYDLFSMRFTIVAYDDVYVAGAGGITPVIR
ncbi:MAG: hypothetical protein AB1733_04645 [Thermodesulfobacteriota bacterium]